jgi:type I site-specific restriction endonuclease
MIKEYELTAKIFKLLEKDLAKKLTGMQQSKEYMERLEVKFAYSTNGHEIEEYDDFRKQPS